MKFSEALLILIVVFIEMAFILGFIIIFIKRYNIRRTRRNFGKKFNINNISKKIIIRKVKQAVNENYYILAYPYWFFSNKDGTADRRRKGNHIVWKENYLYFENYVITCDNPIMMIGFVNKLREQNNIIRKCNEEQDKENRLNSQRLFLRESNYLEGIINKFKEKPTDFEKFCAELFEKMGYRAKLTPPTNDGGYDIKLYKNNIETIVECKCYAIKNKIGRPLIQKLVGANQKEGADKMLFITTSDFSSAAVEFANEVGVELMNGEDVVNLNKRFLHNEEANEELFESDYYLKAEDIKQYFPKDFY